MDSDDPPALDPLAAQAIRNAPGLGIDPRRVAVALGLDPGVVDDLLRDAPAPSAPITPPA
jgi:hypothetical protein